MRIMDDIYTAAHVPARLLARRVSAHPVHLHVAVASGTKSRRPLKSGVRQYPEDALVCECGLGNHFEGLKLDKSRLILRGGNSFIIGGCVQTGRATPVPARSLAALRATGFNVGTPDRGRNDAEHRAELEDQQAGIELHIWADLK